MAEAHTGRLFDHVHLRVADLQASKRFYAGALFPLGLSLTREGEGSFLVDELYVDHASIDGVYFGPVDVPRGDVFLLGDNRGNSEDSRDFGAVPEDDVVGRLLVRIWPLSR